MKTVLYITYNNLGDHSSGSGVRPYEMYKAFLERGYEVKVLSGFCGRGEGRQRRNLVRGIRQWLTKHRPDFCYIESSTYPIMNYCDYSLIRLLHKMKIPVGYFYRDFYRKFPKIFPKRRDLIGALKEYYLDFLQWRTDRILFYVKQVYFPSEVCQSMFSYKNMKALPPAGDVRFLPQHELYKTCIYVGGVSESYGIDLLIKAFCWLNMNRDRQSMYRLILVCREQEYISNKGLIGTHPWLEVHHVSGELLIPLYQMSDVGLLTLRHNAYNELAVGTKLFQYLSYGLPVISTDVASMKAIIDENDFGVTATDDPYKFAEAIRKLLDNHENLKYYRKKIEENLPQKHLWIHRVDKIAEDLAR